MNNDFNIDGNAFLSSIIKANLQKENDNKMLRLLKVFKKHNMSLFEGMALLVEVLAAIGGEENDG